MAIRTKTENKTGIKTRVKLRLSMKVMSRLFPKQAAVISSENNPKQIFQIKG